MSPRTIAYLLVAAFGAAAMAACNGEAGGSSTGTDDTIHVSNSVSGPVAAKVGSAGQPVALTFTSSDTNAITQFEITPDMSALPAGWSAGSTTFSCASVTTGSGCLLNLTYAPTADASDILTLTFAYTNNAGFAKTGTVSIPYSATASDNIVSTVSPAGTITAVAGAGGQAVTLTFTTDDGNPATDLSITSDLGSLPAGWTSASSNFGCSSVSNGSGCQFGLNFAPAGLSSGTLALNYSYTDNSGMAKTGTVNIPYASTVHNTVTASTSPSGQVTANTAGGSQSVAVTFTTSDTNPATSLLMDLNSLPTGWNSSSTSFTCASISSESPCQLSLTYAPITSGSGTLSLPYTYLDNAGDSQTGTLNIQYLAQPLLIYLTQSSQVTYCEIGADGSLGNCTATATTAGTFWSMAFGGDYVYLANNNNNTISSCSVGSDGSFNNCASIASGFNAPWDISINNGYLYVPSFYNRNDLQACAIAGNGVLGSCVQGTYLGSDQKGEVAFWNDIAYVGGEGDSGSPALQACSISNVDGSLSSCTALSGAYGNQAMQRFGNYLYLEGGSLQICPINTDGTLGTCATQNVLVGTNSTAAYIFQRIAILNGRAYVPYEIDDTMNFNFTEGLAICTVNQDGTLAIPCTDSGVTTSEPYSVTTH